MKRAAVDGTKAQARDRVTMRLRRVSFVDGKSVTRKLRIIAAHDPVPGHLGDDRCCRDREAEPVPPDHSGERHASPREDVAIDKQMVWLHGEVCHRRMHRAERCVQNVDFVDLLV